jgi:hypothetical protein
VDSSAFYPGYAACADSVAGKGEAFVSGLVPEAAELAAYLAPLGWTLGALRGPREMAARELPHAGWAPGLPPILTFYSYCEAGKPWADAEGGDGGSEGASEGTAVHGASRPLAGRSWVLAA